MFNTSLTKIFGVQKYADALSKIVRDRNIRVNFQRNLVKIKPEKKEAMFEVLDETKPEKMLETYEVCVTVLPLYCNPSTSSSFLNYFLHRLDFF